MGNVVAAESSKVGCMRQYLLLSLSHRSMLASCSCALLMASACRSALALRSSLWATATLEEWSRAIRPASLGKVQVTRGSVDVGFSRVEVVIRMVGLRFPGWMRETVILEWEASRV